MKGFSPQAPTRHTPEPAANALATVFGKDMNDVDLDFGASVLPSRWPRTDERDHYTVERRHKVNPLWAHDVCF
jgi:hypothetical protein